MPGTSCFASHGVRGKRMRRNPLLTQRRLTTENTEDHGVTRRFIMPGDGVYRMSLKLIARTVAGPVSRCNSVVLGVLRGKTLSGEQNTPTLTLRPATSGAANHPPTTCPP
jgi:hypothetical protein